MTARIIDGAALSQRIREEVAQRVAALAAKGTRPGPVSYTHLIRQVSRRIMMWFTDGRIWI